MCWAFLLIALLFDVIDHASDSVSSELSDSIAKCCQSRPKPHRKRNPCIAGQMREGAERSFPLFLYIFSHSTKLPTIDKRNVV
jgi:hypothetical protein